MGLKFPRSKSSREVLKKQAPNTTSSSPEPAQASAMAAPPSEPPVAKKVEAPKPKPVGPSSIVPPGTKRVLVVGKHVVMTADVDNCDAVIVQGNLDGTIKAKYIVIMKGGCMRGNVECQEADVAGSFEGMEMVVHHRLTLSATARVGGTTTYHRLSVHDGAVLTGELIYKPSTRASKKPPAPMPIAMDAADPEKDRAAIAPEDEQRISSNAAGGVAASASAPINTGSTQ